MPYYSDDLIEEVRSRSDIVDVISGYVHLQKKGSTYFGLCPFHNEKTASFSVTPSKQMYYCFGCGAGGNVFTFLQEYESMTFPEAMEMLADRAGIELPKREYTAEQRKTNSKKALLFEINKEAAAYYYRLLYSPHGQTALNYFHGRELQDDIMKKFGLGYSDKYSDDLYKYLKSKGYKDEDLKDSGLIGFDEVKGGHDKFWNRAMFPIMDDKSQVIAFGGRVMGEGDPKYLNSPETMIFEKSKHLYGMHIAKKTKRPQFILCEGYMDVISLHQAGFDNAVAALGTSFTLQHANSLRKYGKDVYISLDSDKAGVKAALRAIPILKNAGIDSKVINMLPYKDPDEFIKNLGALEYQKRVDEAENSFIFTIRMLENNYDLKDPTGKSRFMDAVADKILEFDTEIEREIYMSPIAERYNYQMKDLKELVAKRSMAAAGQKDSAKVELKSGINKKPNIEDAEAKPMRLLLTWLVENPAIYAIVRPYIDPEDFTEGVYRETATLLFQQFDSGGQIDPSKISLSFEDLDEQKLVSKIFNTSVGEITQDADLAMALKETLIKIKQKSLEELNKHNNTTDIVALTRIIDAKKQLEELEKINLNF